MSSRRLRASWLSVLLPLLVVPLAGSSCDNGTTPEPKLTITFPPDGYFTNDATVTITGEARRGGGLIGNVRVNGNSVLPLSGDPQDGTWSYELTLDPAAIFNPVLVKLDLEGGTQLRRRITIISGDGIDSGYVADGDLSLESIVMRLNDSGLDVVEPVIKDLVDVNVAELLPPGTLVIDNFCYQDSIFGCLGRVDATVSGNPPPSISDFAISVDSETGQAAADIRLDDLYIKTDVVAVTGISFSCEVTVTSATTDILGDYGLQPDALDPSQVDVYQIGGVNVVFGSFDHTTDCGGLLGGVVAFFLDLLVGDIQDIVEPELENYLNTPDVAGNTPVAGAVEEALSAIEIAGPLGEAIGVTLDTELFAVDEDPEGITFGSDGAFVAAPAFAGTCYDDASGLEIQPPDACDVFDPCPVGASCQGPAGECVAHPDSPDLTASYSVAEPFPVFGPIAPSGSPYGLSLGLSTSAFNQLLKSQVECGLLTQDLTSIPGLGVLNGFILSFLIPELAQFPLVTEYELLVRPHLAAIVTGNPGPAGELAELRLAGLEVKLRDVDRIYPTLIRFVIDADLGLNATLVGSELTFSLTAPADPDIQVTFIHNNIGASNSDLSGIVTGLFQVAIPGLAGALGGFPLPEFLGLQLDLVEVERAGEFMSLYLDLTPVP